ncbi:hypothetical protein BGL34_04495 [Fructilactobacillus lindneri]|nr:APC family permease [Fructilactobacillus lindneri]ANZ57594.1 hypothetical protein AYR60_01805 [Fructilactobacillus lindneri]ANZ58863.1 hypothetical protein AYR59_01805 [Fructilactobacillus lindneri]POG97745.1 hypothetical protein BGL31_05950 [Fructilactobacillus lindneri]POH00030.1 hypothetical protein BGL32_04515 [Fructilactobacillus lindneri]POH02457.1 hypothetical protein BGL33_04285 [Fructilactobacillus lindneri]
MLWLISLLLLRGINSTSSASILGIVILILVIGFFVVTMIVMMNWKTFTTNPFADQTIGHLHDSSRGPLFSQVKGAMLTTLFEFVGIESGIVLAGKAKSQHEVRKATKNGFIIAIALFSLTSILPLGLMSYGEIGNLAGISTSTIMQYVMGPIGKIIMTFGAIIAILSSWVSWMVVLIEMPTIGAESGTFPQLFKRRNHAKVPTNSLLATVVLVEFIMLAMHFFKNPFEFCLSMVGGLIIVPYLFSALYLFKVSVKNNLKSLLIATLTIIGVLVIAYCAGIQYLIFVLASYLIGIPVFAYSRRQVRQVQENIIED